MKKSIAFVLILSLVITVFGCATPQDMAQKKASGEAVHVYYDYPWEKVYETYRYVLENSAMEPILARTSTPFSRIKYLTYQKVIMVMFYGVTFRDVELAIYFTPESEKRTKVSLVKGLTMLGTKNQDEAVREIFDEVDFVLKNKGQGYIEYTTANSETYDLEKPFK